MKLKDALKGKVPKELEKFIPSSYEIIGSREKAVVIIEIPKELVKYKKLIGETLLALHKNVTSVLMKKSERKGKYRIRNLEVIAGSKNTEVMHKEHGYRLLLDPKVTYFSPREATERQRIAEQVKPGETVMVMFSGVAPYAIAIAKKQPKVKKIFCIEINPRAHEYASKNIKLNKVEDKIELLLGDVKEYSEKFKDTFDRIIMPLPLEAENFLDIALKWLKKKGIIHLYFVEKEESIKKRIRDIIKKIEGGGSKVKGYQLKRVLPYAPRIDKYCIDMVVEK